MGHIEIDEIVAAQIDFGTGAGAFDDNCLIGGAQSFETRQSFDAKRLGVGEVVGRGLVAERATVQDNL